MTTEELVVALAKEAHTEHWSATSDVSSQTRAAQNVGRAWQLMARKRIGDHLVAEHALGGTEGKEAIDLIDINERIAYELKASPNNTHMEFYRDVFKVLVFNRRNPEAPLKKLVFLTPAAGAVRLRRSLGQDVAAIARELGLDVRIADI